MGANKVSMVDVKPTVLLLWQKIVLPKVLYGKVHCHDAKSTCATTDFMLFDECDVINIPKYEDRMLGSLFVLENQICD
jgi:hypothetical protein